MATILAAATPGCRVMMRRAGCSTLTTIRAGRSAARIGVQRGDRLLGLGGVALDSVSAFRRKMIELRGARSTLLSIGRGPYQYNVQIALAR